MTSDTQSNHSKKSKNKLWIILIFASLLVFFGIIGIRLFQNNDDLLQIGQVPKNIVLETYYGEKIEASSLIGKVVLINFWVSWCAPCEDEALILEDAWQHIRLDFSEEVIFFGLAYTDTEPASHVFLEEYGISYPNGPDLRGEISNVYHVKGVPETYILDRQGRLQYIKYGPFVSSEETISAIEPIHPGG